MDWNGNFTEKQFVDIDNESPQQHRKRWLSVKILCLTMFFDSLSFSIVLSSIWPYLQKVGLNPQLSPVYAGWANVGFQLAGILIDFFIGIWTNRRGSTEPILFSLLFFGIGNVMYGYAQSCGSFGVAMVILSRSLIGLSTGVDVVSRVVLSESTTLKERTTAMAHMSIAHGLGFSFGPAVQLATIPLGDEGIYIDALKVHLNLYTAPAFFSIIIAIINAFIVIGWYEEFCIDIYKDHKNDEKVHEYRTYVRCNSLQHTKSDPVAILFTLFLYFVGQCAFGLYETILSPLAMDQLAWSGKEAALYVGFLFLAGGIIAVFTFGITDILVERINERMILFTGFILLVIGFTVHLPWGNTFPEIKTQAIKNETFPLAMQRSVGCPEEYSWCSTTPQIHLFQMVVGMIFLSFGYPFVLVITTTIYSKILGPRPQGLMQGWFAASGGAARTLAPALVTYVYVSYGPRWTFASVDTFVMLTSLLVFLLYKRLIPYHLFILKKHRSILDSKDEYDATPRSLNSSISTTLEEDCVFISVV